MAKSKENIAVLSAAQRAAAKELGLTPAQYAKDRLSYLSVPRWRRFLDWLWFGVVARSCFKLFLMGILVGAAYLGGYWRAAGVMSGGSVPVDLALLAVTALNVWLVLGRD